MRYTKINGKDFSAFFTMNTGGVTYEKRRGNNTGIMISGLKRDDILKRAAVVTRKCTALTDAQASAILMEVDTEEFVELEYYDPKRGDYRTISALCEISRVDSWEDLVGGNYWARLVLTFTER